MIKPMLASDFDESKLRLPCTAQPKIDGVRGINLNGTLTGRSLKTHKNKFTTALFSKPKYLGFDGEMTPGMDTTTPDLCRNTTSAINTIEGMPSIWWCVFDLITEDTINLPYSHRYALLKQMLDEQDPPNVMLVPSLRCTNLDELLALEDSWLELGYEGAIIRDPNGLYKQGRSTVKEGGLLRIKRFIEEEAVVLGVVEGQANGNEAKTNELGRTERSSHQANMTPNGLLGTLLCRIEKDILDSKGAVLFAKGLEVTVSAGNMDHNERRDYFVNQHKIVGQTIKFKMFPKGVKDKPRFPTFVSIRASSDKV